MGFATQRAPLRVLYALIQLTCRHMLTHCAVAVAVLTGNCNGLCQAETTIAKLHSDPSCTKALTADLPMLHSWYDYSAVGCIKVDDSGSINKTSCDA